MNDWATQELRLLRHCWPQLECDESTGWCRIPDYAVPQGWSKTTVEVAFQIPDNLPGQAPYAFWIRDGIQLAAGSPPTDYNPQASTPWGGLWGQFSWTPESWAPGPQPGRGTTMVDFVRSFADRLQDRR